MSDSSRPRAGQEPAALAVLEEATAASGFGMPSDRLTGMLLAALAATKPGGRLLELGTGTGLATSWLLHGMDATAHLTSIDNDAAVFQGLDNFSLAVLLMMKQYRFLASRFVDLSGEKTQDEMRRENGLFVFARVRIDLDGAESLA